MTAMFEIRASLLAAIEARSADAFEDAVASAYRAGLPAGLEDIFAAAIVMPWHTRHEDLALALQKMKVAPAVDALYEAALSTHPYLEHDESFGLARKCTWALADIGTPDAKKQLERLAECSNQTISGYARKRLDHWDDELHRKAR